MLVQNYFRGGVETKCIMAKVKVANAHILEACLSNQQSVKRGKEWQGQTLGAHFSVVAIFWRVN